MPTLLTRRRFLRLSASTLLASGLWPGRLFAGNDKAGSFRFIAVNDFHYLNNKCAPWFERVIKSMQSHEGVELILISGDLVEHGTKEQFGAIHDLLSTLRVAYYVVVGNHDYRTQTDRKHYEQLFPDRINYHLEHQSWQLIGFDTTDGMKSQNVSAPKSTLDWLDSTLPKLDNKKPTILFTHFPLGFGVPFILKNAENVLERFKAFNVRAAYCGHYHGFTEKKTGDLVMTTDKCCSFSRANHDKTPEKGYFLCRAENGMIQRTFVEVK